MIGVIGALALIALGSALLSGSIQFVLCDWARIQKGYSPTYGRPLVVWTTLGSTCWTSGFLLAIHEIAVRVCQ